MYILELTGGIIDFVLQLLINLLSHADAAGTYRVPKALQAAVHIDRQAAIPLKEAVHNILVSGTPLAETKIFIDTHFCDREAVMDLC